MASHFFRRRRNRFARLQAYGAVGDFVHEDAARLEQQDHARAVRFLLCRAAKDGQAHTTNISTPA